jgi:hypothetical protein
VGLVLLAVLAVGLVAAMGAFASGKAPKAETRPAENVGRKAATLEARVYPEGAVTECKFEYGIVKGSLTKEIPCAYPPGERPITVPEEAQLTGLAESTTYYFRIVAKNANGTATGLEKEFTTLPAAPRAKNPELVEAKRTTAIVSGEVTPNESEVTECFFTYGTEPSNEPNHAQCEPSHVAAGGEPSEEVKVVAKITGLAEHTKYYFKLFAKNSVGSDTSGGNNFSTLPSAPHAGDVNAVHIEHTSATLIGEVRPNDSKVTECFFEYGPPVEEGKLEKSVPCASFPTGEGEAKEPVEATVTGLTEATRYEFRLVAGNALGQGVSGNNGLTTKPSAPYAEMHHAKNVTNESAELSASVNPHGGNVTECYFEYGLTPALGGVIPCSSLPGAGEELVHVTAKLGGLKPGTEYLVRIVAINAGGEGRAGDGEHHNFITSTGADAPVITKIKPPKGPSSGGNKVTIVGQHFEHIIAVDFGNAEAEIVHSEVLKLEVIAPPGVGKVEIIVLTEAGTSELTKADEYTYGKPEILSLEPNGGPVAGGTQVTVTGSGFELGEHGTTFKFGKATASSVNCTSTTECLVISPQDPKENKFHELEPKLVKVQAEVNGKHSPNKVTFNYE